MIRLVFLLPLAAAACAGAPPRSDTPAALLDRLGAADGKPAMAPADGSEGATSRAGTGAGEPAAMLPRPAAAAEVRTRGAGATPSAAPSAGELAHAAEADTSLAAMPLDVVEAKLVADIRAMHEGGGRNALEAVVPGSDAYSRLLFCYCRLLLQRPADARAELERLTAAAPQCAAALLALGKLDLDDGRYDDAVTHLGAARTLERARDLEPHAELATLLGAALLRTAASEQGEHLLREEVARGPRPALAALRLADWLEEAERLSDAQGVVDAALRREPDHPELRLARVDLLLDLGQATAALAALRALAADAPHPLLRLKLVQVLRQVGEVAAATELLGELVVAAEAADTAGQPGAAAHLAQLRGLGRILDQERAAGRRLAYGDRELLALVRTASSVADRIAALRELAARPDDGDLRRALRLALHDEDATLRIAGLRTYYDKAQVPHDAVRGGLADTDARVRGAAARLARRLPPATAVELLLPRLEHESEPYAFRQMHETLVQVSGNSVLLPIDGEQDAQTRRRVVADWRRHWQR